MDEVLERVEILDLVKDLFPGAEVFPLEEVERFRLVDVNEGFAVKSCV